MKAIITIKERNIIMNKETKVRKSKVHHEFLAYNLRVIRASSGISQIDVAKGIGVDKTVVSKWEWEINEPGFESLRKIIEFYRGIGFDVDYNTFLLKPLPEDIVLPLIN